MEMLSFGTRKEEIDAEALGSVALFICSASWAPR
jgi:hypothetical protein